MPHDIASVALVVGDDDEAIACSRDVLGFKLREDAPRTDGSRGVRVGPTGARTSPLLAKTNGKAQRAPIGDRAGDRVGFFLHIDDVHRDHATLAARGVSFVEDPREEGYGTVAVFKDLCGSRCNLREMRE